MRAITCKAAVAFEAGRPFRSGNTAVRVTDSEVALVLHGNTIAVRDKYDQSLMISLCGWNTRTTRDRLNGLAGVRVYTHKGQVYLNGRQIESYGWVAVV